VKSIFEHSFKLLTLFLVSKIGKVDFNRPSFTPKQCKPNKGCPTPTVARFGRPAILFGYAILLLLLLLNTFVLFVILFY